MSRYEFVYLIAMPFGGKGGVRSHRRGVVWGCNQPDVGSGNRTKVLYNSSACSSWKTLQLWILLISNQAYNPLMQPNFFWLFVYNLAPPFSSAGCQVPAPWLVHSWSDAHIVRLLQCEPWHLPFATPMSKLILGTRTSNNVCLFLLQTLHSILTSDIRQISWLPSFCNQTNIKEITTFSVGSESLQGENSKCTL